MKVGEGTPLNGLDAEARHRDRIALALLAAAVGLLLAGSTAAQPSTSAQSQVDAADPGDVVALEPGTYEEQLTVDRPVTLEGRGEVVIDGGSGPAIEVTEGPVRVANLTLRSTGTPALVHGAGSATFWRVSIDAGAPVDVRDTRWFRAFDAVDEPGVDVEARNATVVHGHPVRLTLQTEDGEPYAGGPVTVRDGSRTVLERTTGSDGEVPEVPVADRWTRWSPEGLRLDEGTNRTSVVALGWQVDAALEPGVEEVDLTVRTASDAGADETPGWAWALGLGSVTAAGAGVAAFRYHDGFRWWWLSLFAPLYTRLARSELLDHDTRAEIYNHLDEHPGTHLRQLKRELDLKHGTLLHHLQMLEDQEMIRSVKDGMYRRFYLSEDAPTHGGTPSTRERVERAILAEPGTTNQAIAEALDEQASTIHYHVDSLVEEDRVRKEREGRKVRLYPSEEWVPTTAS